MANKDKIIFSSDVTDDEKKKLDDDCKSAATWVEEHPKPTAPAPFQPDKVKLSRREIKRLYRKDVAAKESLEVATVKWKTQIAKKMRREALAEYQTEMVKLNRKV